MNIPDPRKINRSIHAAYVKLNEFLELHVIQNVEQYKEEQVIFYYDNYYFTVNDTKRIYDWTLNAKETELMFQYAIKTYKIIEKNLKETKKELYLDKKIRYND